MVDLGRIGAGADRMLTGNSSALPDAPAREAPAQASAQTVRAERRSLTPDTPTRVGDATPIDASRQVDDRKAAAALTPSKSGVTTYRDQETGRLIVRVFDRERGDVLVEFPPEQKIPAAAKPAQPPVTEPRHLIDA